VGSEIDSQSCRNIENTDSMSHRTANEISLPRLLFSDTESRVGRLRIDVRALSEAVARVNTFAPLALQSQQSPGSNAARKTGRIVGGALLVAAGVALISAAANYQTQAAKDCLSETLPSSAIVAACLVAREENPVAPGFMAIGGGSALAVGGALVIWGFR
jgi:hypothetical protein